MEKPLEQGQKAKQSFFKNCIFENCLFWVEKVRIQKSVFSKSSLLSGNIACAKIFFKILFDLMELEHFPWGKNPPKIELL